MGYKVLKNPLNENRFSVYDDAGNVVAQGDYKGRSDEQILEAAMSKVGGKTKPSNPVNTILGLGQQLVQQPKEGKPVLEATQKLQEIRSKEIEQSIPSRLEEGFPSKPPTLSPVPSASEVPTARFETNIPTINKLLGVTGDLESAKKFLEVNKGLTDEGAQKFVSTGKSLSKILGHLDQLEPKSGISGRISGAVETIKGMAGYSPHQSTYDDSVAAFASPVAKVMFMESGSLATGDVERAKRFFPKSYNTPEERAYKIEMVKTILENNTGMDWGPYFDKYYKKHLPEGVGSMLSEQEKQAAVWASRNRNDPRAMEILKRMDVYDDEDVKAIMEADEKDTKSKPQSLFQPPAPPSDIPGTRRRMNA